MIGFDRPIRPEWIYEILKVMKIGDKPEIYNDIFANIAKELIGKEGKRKARTVIYRSFIYNFQNGRGNIENNIFFELSKKHNLSYLKPLFLINLILSHDALLFFVDKLKISFTSHDTISSSALSDKMVFKYGDRDVVKRSVRAFLKTLCHFDVMVESSKQEFRLLKKYELSDEQVRDFILIYSSAYLKSEFLNIMDMDKRALFFCEDIDFLSVAKKFHGANWEFIRDGHRNILLVK